MTSKTVENLSFEEAMGELQTIVRKLETGDSALEDSISDYERGTLLKTHCESKLNDAKAKIEKIILQKDGSVKTQPLDPEE